MKLKKFHGLGNEFLLTSIRSLPKDSSRIAKFLCDYTKGPGADGLIFSLPEDQYFLFHLCCTLLCSTTFE